MTGDYVEQLISNHYRPGRAKTRGAGGAQGSFEKVYYAHLSPSSDWGPALVIQITNIYSIYWLPHSTLYSQGRPSPHVVVV